MALRLGRWGFFVVVLALLPVALGGVSSITRGGQALGFESIFDRGDLLLVTTAVLGAALAELFGEHDGRFNTIRFFVGCFAGTVLVAASTWFADIAGALRDGVPTDHHAIAIGSLWLFGIAVLSGIAVLIVAQVSEDAAKQSEEQQ